MPDNEQLIHVERRDEEVLIIGEPLTLARAFFTGDRSSVGEDSFDRLAGGGEADKIVLDDIKAVNRTMRARSPHKNWAAIINGHFGWLTAIPDDLDLLESGGDEWMAANGDELIDAALTAVLGKGRGLAVATKVLHLKRPRLFPVLDRFVAEMFGVNVPSAPTPEQRQAIGHQLVQTVRREGRRNIEVLRWIQQKLHDEGDIDRPLARIFDGLVWFSHPAASVVGATRSIEVRLQAE